MAPSSTRQVFFVSPSQPARVLPSKSSFHSARHSGGTQMRAPASASAAETVRHMGFFRCQRLRLSWLPGGSLLPLALLQPRLKLLDALKAGALVQLPPVGVD